MTDYNPLLEAEVERLEAIIEDWKSLFYENDFDLQIKLLEPWRSLDVHVETVPNGWIMRAWKYHNRGGEIAKFWNGSEWAAPDTLSVLAFGHQKDLIKECPEAVIKCPSIIMKILKETKENPF